MITIRRKKVKLIVLAVFVCCIAAIIGKLSNYHLDQDTGVGLAVVEGTQELEAKVAPLKKQRKEANEIRFATFGTSFSWGSTLANREEEAFTWLLSPDASNYALPATGSEYPARCVSSMIGDNVYDVIILEFTMRVEESTITLAKRLRQRFPDALIIYLKLWGPVSVKSRKGDLDLRQIATHYGFSLDTFMYDENFYEFLKDNNFNDLYLDFGRNYPRYEERLVSEAGVYVSSLEEIPVEDPIGWLSQQAFKFSPRDSFHPSKEGHIDAARIVNEIVDRVGVPKHPRVNDFESFDNCANWLVDEDQAKGVTYSPNGYIHTIPTKQKKHALSFKGGKGSIMLTNPFNDWKYLTISYMTTGPAPSKYPEVELAISPPLNTTTILDPNTERAYVRPVHLPREYFVGKVPPGDITLSFSTLTRSTEPFRIVSYTMSSTKPVMSIV